MARVRIRRRSLQTLLSIDSHQAYHAHLFREALDPYLEDCKRAGREPGHVLAIGAGWREAEALATYPFQRVVLSGILEPDERIQAATARHPRLTYELANAEALPYAGSSFDLVLCKESLHHLPRPALGLYEMLRVCRHRAVFLEPWDCAVLAGFDRLGLTTRFERNLDANLQGRDNFVYRWSARGIESLLASYYIDSGERAEVDVGWLSTRILMARTPRVRKALLAAGWAMSWLPGGLGNHATVALVPGENRPADPAPVSEIPGF
ncbi:MAG: class I SAM-dependent methyltransferase [Myxococcota bacterium]